ncbi:glycosyltransferase family 2 protein [Roseococcus sp.]|uniref:glycosyltransferase family 2 protein n=1 Tax=Roseococcus sp. TaxID=2109646 RepID=UPI003BA965F2
MAGLRSVSVVIPTYNRAYLLQETLEAVLGQTSPAAEVILVDDGSTDGTPELVEASFGGRVIVHRIPNSGDLAARNHGMAAASGELVAFCDSDDLWDPEFLAEMQALWRAEARVVAGFGNFRIIQGSQWQTGDKFADAPPDFWDGARRLGRDHLAFDHPIVDRLIRFQPFFPSGLVVDRRRFLEMGGWDESVGRTVGTDFATMLRLAEHAPLGMVLKPLVGIRKHSANYSADVQAMNLGDAAILEQMLLQRPSLRRIAGDIRASIASRRRQALDLAFTRGDFAAVQAIFEMLPVEERGRMPQMKAWVARLPQPIAAAVGALLLRLGTWRASARSSAAG